MLQSLPFAIDIPRVFYLKKLTSLKYKNTRRGKYILMIRGLRFVIHL